MLFLMFTMRQKANNHKGQFIHKFEYESKDCGNDICRQFEDGKKCLGFGPTAQLAFKIVGHRANRSINATFKLVGWGRSYRFSDRLGEHTIVGVENLFKKQYSQHELQKETEVRSQ